jgi:hypothetical protein
MLLESLNDPDLSCQDRVIHRWLRLRFDSDPASYPKINSMQDYRFYGGDIWFHRILAGNYSKYDQYNLLIGICPDGKLFRRSPCDILPSAQLTHSSLGSQRSRLSLKDQNLNADLPGYPL